MLKHERHAYILNRLHLDAKVDALTLSQDLQLSEATIRRDLTELDGLGKLRKVHGGAIPSLHPVLTFQQRTQVNQQAKDAIARKALSLLQPGMLIMLDGGTTNLQLARLIPQDFSATIVTNSPGIAQQFNQHARIQLIMPGGVYMKEQDVLSGAQTCEMLQGFNADLYLLGVCSLHPERGATVYAYEEALVKKTMIAASLQVVALVHTEKLDKFENYKVCDISRINTLVTELDTKDERLLPYQQLSMHIL